MTRDERWAIFVRVLALLTVALAVLAYVESRTIRELRGAVQQLRTERESVRLGHMAVWTQVTSPEFVATALSVDEFYRDPVEGFGRPAGLCPSGMPDFAPVAAWVLGAYVPARVSGHTPDAARSAMRTAIMQSDAFRAVRPNLALPRAGK